MRFVIAAAAALAAGPALAQDDAALIEQGMTLFQQNCRTCHVVKEGENRLGPSLYGVVGREVGTVEGFSYSNSLASSGETWTEEHLDTYLQDPDGLYPGTRMLFAGLPDEEARSAIIAYLKSEGGSAEGEDTGS